MNNIEIIENENAYKQFEAKTRLNVGSLTISVCGREHTKEEALRELNKELNKTLYQIITLKKEINSI
jgi:hypothetical protein